MGLKFYGSETFFIILWNLKIKCFESIRKSLKTNQLFIDTKFKKKKIQIYASNSEVKAKRQNFSQFRWHSHYYK